MDRNPKGGISRYNPYINKWTHYYFDPENLQAKTLMHNTVTTIWEDSKNNFWIGNGRGLSKFDLRKNQWTHFTTNEGFPGSLVNGILGDNKGYLWISSDRGISCFNPETDKFENFDIIDGLQEWAFNPNVCLKSHDGKMYFGGNNGFNCFNPENVNDNPFLPPVALTDFSGFNEKITSDYLYLTGKTFSLSTDGKFISLTFAALSYANPGKNQFAYKLEGRDKYWIYQGTKRIVSLSNLKKDKYTLKVKASNNHGVWNEDGLSIQIEVKRLSWKENWFVGLIVLIILFSLILILIRMKKRAHLHTENKEELNRFFFKYKITKREQEILILLIRGKRNKEIGEELFISQNTARNHIHNIYKKLNIKNRLQLIDLIRKT